MDRVVRVKDNYVLISGSFERFKKYGENIIPVPSENIHPSKYYKAHLDAILDTYDQYNGQQITSLIRDTGLLNIRNGDYLNMSVYRSYFISIIKSNIKLNNKLDVYDKEYFTRAPYIQWTYIIVLFFSLFLQRMFDSILVSLIGLIIAIFNLKFIRKSINKQFKAAMKVEKYKLEKNRQELEETR